MIPARQLREKTSQELLDQWALEKKRIFDSTVRGSSGEAIKPHEKRAGKRVIAQIQTILAERARRAALDRRIVDLEHKAEGASPAMAAMARRQPRPHLGRIRARGTAPSTADRAAAKWADAKRLRVCVQREDPGEQK